MAKRKARSTSEGEWEQGKPLYRSPDPSHVPGAWFDQAAVDRVVRALRALRHTKGRWAGRPFEPEPWQIEHIIAPIYGWKGADGLRIVRTAWIEIPRKNGKSTIAAGLGLVGLAADGEMGAEVYSAAASRDQARIVFDEAKRMAQRAPALRGKLKCYAASIVAPSTGGSYKVLSSLVEVAHGLNVHTALVDEVHVHKNRGLIDALETGTGAREQPLILFITTADEGEQHTIYAEKHEYAVKIAAGVIDDPTFYTAIWAADDDDDVYSPATWAKANPNLGVTIAPDFIAKEAQRAQASPTFYASFCRLYLNRRVRVEARWLPLATWDASAGIVDVATLEKQPCYVGVDLASTIDLAAVALLFPREDASVDVLMRFYIPADNIGERVQRDRVPYDVWVRDGLITATPGNVIDYAFIRKDLNDLAERFDIQEVAYDPWNAMQFVLQLQEEDGFTCVPIRQGYASLSGPTKEAIRLVMAKNLRHGGHPVLRWCADNMVTRQDPSGNLKPDKEHSVERIDGMAALITGLARLTAHADETSVYEERGVLTFG